MEQTKTARILNYMETHKVVTSGQLSKALNIPYNSITGIIAPLCERGVLLKFNETKPAKYSLSRSIPPKPTGNLCIKCRSEIGEITDTEIASKIVSYITELEERDREKIDQIAFLNRKVEELKTSLQRIQKTRDLSKILVTDSKD